MLTVFINLEQGDNFCRADSGMKTLNDKIVSHFTI